MLWGSRFNDKPDKDFLQFSSSINFDVVLFSYEMEVNKAHVKMLSKCKLITEKDAEEIETGLNKILQMFDNNNWNPVTEDYEDIHSAIENKLTEEIGSTAKKLHTARSRNDLVATSTRLWVIDVSKKIIERLTQLQKEFLKLSGQHIETIIPGYTHLQRAQPVSLAFHLLAYVEMFERDKKRFQNVIDEADECPLGSGAIAGTTLPIDREFAAKLLGFSGISRNAMDAVSNRDFAIDFLNACSNGMMHLSRLCEEFILWSSSEWNFVEFGDSVTTGSSLMPQKKNSDFAELIRGKFGRILGNHVSLMTTMKSLPLSYNRDMQEDKEPMFDSFFNYNGSLKIIHTAFSDVKINADRFTEELDGDYSLATDIVDWLVLQNIPFREAHEITGSLIKYAVESKKKLNELTLAEYKNINPVFNEEVLELSQIDTALQRKKSAGSPNPKLVEEQIKQWRQKLQ